MWPPEILSVVESVLESVEPGSCVSLLNYPGSLGWLNLTVVNEETLHQLQAVFPDSLLEAAFDIVDRENG